MRRIDRDDRTQAVYEAAVEVLALGGYPALTLRALADSLGGSMTLVTHYFPTQRDLIRGVLDHQFAVVEAEVAELQTNLEDPAARLRALLEWFLPVDDASWLEERARVLLAIHAHGENAWMDEHLDRMEQRMRGLLRERLRPLVALSDLDLAVDMVRATINGIVLSAVEHRAHWTADRQRAVLDVLWTTLPWRSVDAPTA